MPRLAGKLPPFGRHAGAALVAHGYLGQDDLWPVLRAHAEWVMGRAVEALLDAGGFDASLGARPMRRTIGRLVEAPLAEMILRGDLGEGAVALLDVEEGKIVVDAIHARAAE